MKKLFLMALVATGLTAGTVAVAPVAPIEPITTMPAKTTILLGVAGTYFHNDCGCGEASTVHGGALVGIDYQVSKYFGIDARFNSSWLQTGVYTRVGDINGVYALLGYNYSHDIKDGGISYGVGAQVLKDFNLEAMGTNIEDIALVSTSLNYTF